MPAIGYGMSDRTEIVGMVVRGVILIAAIAAVVFAPLITGDTYATGLVSGGVLGGLLVEAGKWFFSK